MELAVGSHRLAGIQTRAHPRVEIRLLYLDVA
jgi:hypothetical protein